MKLFDLTAVERETRHCQPDAVMSQDIGIGLKLQWFRPFSVLGLWGSLLR